MLPRRSEQVCPDCGRPLEWEQITAGGDELSPALMCPARVPGSGCEARGLEAEEIAPYFLAQLNAMQAEGECVCGQRLGHIGWLVCVGGVR